VALEAELDRLYDLPLNEFVGARDELAKQLRGDGRREEAEQIKGLRKPSVAAWLVNAGDTLRKAQVEASEDFAEARRDEQRALQRLAEGAREIASREGTGQATVAQATQTLRAASLTDEGRELLKRGRLTEELEPPGFEALTGLVPPQPRRKSRPKPKEEPKRPSRAARQRAQKLRQAEKDAVAAARAAEREAERAEKEAAKLRERAVAARAKAETASAERETAERELSR
jgi:hypothetical protein